MTTIEKVKEFWNSRPCNIKHSCAPVGSLEYFNDIDARKYFVEPHIGKFADFESCHGMKVLEIGCGLGTDTINFARCGAEVTAVDVSEESIRIAKIRAGVYGFQDDIKFYCCDAEELSKTVPVEKYDLIYAFGSIHHTPEPEKIIKELKKYCNKDTVLKVMLYNKYSWKVAGMLFKYGYTKNFLGKFSEAQFGCPVTYAYTQQEAIELLDGFDVREIRIEHIFPYQIEPYKRYEYKKEWYFRLMPGGMFSWLERTYGWHMLITAKLEEKGI